MIPSGPDETPPKGPAASLALLAAVSRDPVYLLDADSGAFRLLGGPADLLGAEGPSAAHEDDRPRLEEHRRHLAEAPAGSALEVELRLPTAEGGWQPVVLREMRLAAGEGGGGCILGTARAAGPEGEAELLRRLDLAMKTAGVASFAQDRDLRYRWIFNPALGKAAEEVIGRDDFEIMERLEDAEALAEIKRRVIETGEPEHHTVTVHNGGEALHYELNAHPWTDPATGETVGIVAAALDVTRYQRTLSALASSREAQQAALERREMLLRELNHRIKNSLQLVASLLRLQAGHIGDAAARTELERACERVSAVAEIHARLYMTEEVGELDFGDYLRALCERVPRTVRAHDPGLPDVAVTVDAGSHLLDVDRAIPLGIVANELVTNAVLHGFPGRPSGRVAVSFRREGEGCILTVEDDGVGAPPRPEREGLGLRLVRVLAEQLGAALSVTSGPGLRYDLRVPPGR